MLLHEIPGQFRIVYVHGDSAGTRGFDGDSTQGVVPIWLTAPNHEDASKILTPVYVQYRSPNWGPELPWAHVPMSLELFRVFLTSQDESLRYLEKTGRRYGICTGLLDALTAVPAELLIERLEQAISQATVPSVWQWTGTADPAVNTPVWACIYHDLKPNGPYEVRQLVYSGYSWFYETGELSAPPDYFAEVGQAAADAPAMPDSAPLPPPVRVLPWRPWV